MNADHSDTDDANGDGEGVWSPDIEQCFREALLLFPPCGRRKHILQEEGGGKMYGRNELIARHIMMRTGKVRTRKQVSSHIQVLARRKAKAEVANASGGGSTSPSSVASGAMLSSNGRSMRPHSASSHPDHASQNQDRHQQPSNMHSASAAQLNHSHHHHPITGAIQATPIGGPNSGNFYDIWVDRSIVTQKIRLVTFSAFIEHRRPTMGASDIVNNNSSNHNSIHNNNINDTNNNHAIVTNPQATSIFQPTNNHSQAIQLTPTTASDTDIEMGDPDAVAASSFNQHQLNTSTLPSTTAEIKPPSVAPTTAGSHLLDQTIAFSGAPNLTAAHTNHLNRLAIDAPLSANATQLSGFTRHSYVKIDFRHPQSGIMSNKLERIDISQIQDKFPEIAGSEGLFQRGPPDAFFLVKFWADLSNDYEYNVDDQNSYFGFTSHFETIDPYKNITCSTKACSYGLQVVEKVEKIYGAFNNSNGRYSYGIERSPMCEFMIQFIKKLRQLPRASQMNSVLENFTVLQVVTSEATSEILLCLAFVFEIASPEQVDGPQYHVYKLTKD